MKKVKCFKLHLKLHIFRTWWKKDKNKWQAFIYLEGKQKNLGHYDDLELAELVAQEARLKYHGDFANHG